MNFDIDPAYLTSVTVTETHRPHANKEILTPAELVEVLSHTHTVTSICTQDHPEFTKLRDQLEASGYIACEHRWWNGDQVIKQFSLNHVTFAVRDNFPCASAMRSHMQYLQGRTSNQ